MNQTHITDAKVERIDRHTVKLCWEPAHKNPTVSIYNGAHALERKIPATDCPSGCLEISENEPHIRYYYRLEDDNGYSLMAAERRVYLEGAVNFRDIGGYLTQDGRRVRWGKVFRSDGLSRLTDHDHRLMKNMGIRRIIDFRTPAEIESSPDRLPADGSMSHVNLAVTHGTIDFVEALKRLKKGDSTWLTPDFMVNGYVNNIDQFAHVWGSVINQVAISDGDPVLFHCTGGKDRTGTCAALILLALGVPEETVVDDHQLSNIYIADLLPAVYASIASYGVDPDLVFPYLTAPRDCILAVLDHISEKYGSASDYLATKAGVSRDTQESLKKKMLI
ncbi:MAG: tyrosine-protein phosphatase [Desulfobacterales bacterium]|nr:tyrosine-protein phosphatase [Desulfobacterales bacterium]